MTQEQLSQLRAKVTQLKDQSDMCLASISMLERNVRELVQQLHVLHNQLQANR